MAWLLGASGVGDSAVQMTFLASSPAEGTTATALISTLAPSGRAAAC
jgi:hypothetical protein